MRTPSAGAAAAAAAAAAANNEFNVVHGYCCLAVVAAVEIHCDGDVSDGPQRSVRCTSVDPRHDTPA